MRDTATDIDRQAHIYSLTDKTIRGFLHRCTMRERERERAEKEEGGTEGEPETERGGRGDHGADIIAIVQQAGGWTDGRTGGRKMLMR